MKKKILHILKSSSYSGAESVVITIISSMQDEYDFYYASLDGSIGKLLKSKKINYIPIKKFTFFEIKKIIADVKPDLIHAHDFTASIICSIASGSIPVISHLHNNVPWLKTYHPKSFLYLLSSKFYKQILLVSPSILNEYVFGSFIKNKCTVVYNLIDTKRIVSESKIDLNKNSKHYDILFIGRLSNQKDPLRFIQIIDNIVKRKSNVKVAMLGTGNLADACRKKICDRKLEKNIEILGFVDNPYRILKNAKVLCITSKWEGYGLVAIEALALGVPVAATKVGGLVNILNDNCGKLCDTDDSFIEEIFNLINDKQYYLQKSKKALERIEALQDQQDYIGNLKMIYDRY